MFRDRRKSPRVAVSQLAKVQTRADAFPRDCRVTDISETGVRLFVEGLDLPDEFVLLVDGLGRRDCRVAWRLGLEVGAEFVVPGALPRLATLARIPDAPPQAPAASRLAEPAGPLRVAPAWRRGMHEAPKTRPILCRTLVNDRVTICAWSHIQDCWLEQILTAEPAEREPLEPIAWADIPPFDVKEEE